MNIDQAIFALMTADPYAAGVASQFGVGNNARIYPMRMPEKPVLPAVVYRVFDNERVRSHDGPSGMASPQYEFTIWGQTRESARAAAEVVRRAIDGFPRDGASGVVTGRDGQTLLIHGILLQGGGGDLYDDDKKLYGFELLFQVMHTED